MRTAEGGRRLHADRRGLSAVHSSVMGVFKSGRRSYENTFSLLITTFHNYDIQKYFF